MLRAREEANPGERMLRVYAFDPSRGRRLENHLTVKIPYETLAKGPVGRKIAVIDYDASNQCYYEGVDLDAKHVLAKNGLEPSESNPLFHQQMVYAVVMETIRRFELALGREIKWRPDTGPRDAPYHGRLRVHPHAMQDSNAYYDPAQRALCFGYFRASDTDAGSNLPGQVVFTCLSHDIVVHETTHAILDGIREYFSEPTGIDAAAFHEGFADIIALLQHFSFKESLVDTIQRTGGFIHRARLAPDASPTGAWPSIGAEVGEANPMVDLARQFGEAMGNRQALRSALGTRPDPKALERTTEPHDRGAILVAAVFDAFFSLYVQRTRDLVRMTYPDGREPVPNFLHADLANRLADEAARTAGRIQTICTRALDYCPPVDITFGDFLRAMVTSDREAVSNDGYGYRAALIDAFRRRGIPPGDATSYDEDALAWEQYDSSETAIREPNFASLWARVNALEETPDPRLRSAVFRELWSKAAAHRSALGLGGKASIHAQSVHPLYRVRPNGSMQRRLVAELTQQVEVPVDPRNPSAGTFTFRGGTTLLISRNGNVRYSISKPIAGEGGRARLERQREYIAQLATSFALAPFVAFDQSRDLSFKSIHRGY